MFRTISIALLTAASLGVAAIPASAAPASGSLGGVRSSLDNFTPAQYCRCGRVCYAYDYYGRCVSWRCKACYYRYYRY